MSATTPKLTAAHVASMAGAGWYRWGQWAAHYFVNGEQACSTTHSFAAGGFARGLSAQAPKPAELTPHGEPYGRVCQRCLKVARNAAGRAALARKEQT